MSTAFARFHQAFIPESFQRDDAQYNKAKNLLGLMFAAVGAVPPFAALYIMLGHTGAAWAIGLTLPAMALCVVSMRVLGSLWLAQYGAMFSLFALFCYLIWSMGGNPVTSVNAWFASVPLVATFLLGLRQGLLWLGLAVLAQIGFATANAYGLGHFPANPVNDPRLLDIISNIGLIPFVAGLALYFQFTKDQSDAIRRSQVSTIEQLMAEVTRLSVQVQGQVEHMVGALDEQSRDAHVLRDASEANEALVVRLQETSTHLVEEAERAHRNAEQGADVVGAAITTTEALATSIGQADALVRALHARSQDISSVVDKIKGLAFQTNILALNATIEAAHAGAQGKGFAVVADNVRRLAGEAGEAASEISRELGVVLDNIGQTAQLLDSSQQQAASGRSSAAMAKEALGVIQSSVLSVHAAMAALQDVSARQSQQNLALKSVAGRLEHGIEQVAQGSGTINRAMSQLTERLHHVAN